VTDTQADLRVLPTIQPAGLALSKTWEQFYSRCDRFIRRIASDFRILPRPADDFAAEVWLEGLKKLPHLKLDATGGSFGGWLRILTRRKIAKCICRARRCACATFGDRDGTICANIPGEAST
jgi:DNA-directed RNA polymerase specialized sigma24 family protein